MPLIDRLPSGLTLSNKEKAQLELIERAATQSVTRRLFELIGVAVVPGIFLGMYAYFLHHAPAAGLALCKLRGPFYIPEAGALEKLLRIPIGFLFVTVLLWVATTWHLQLQRRLIYRIVSRAKSESTPA